VGNKEFFMKNFFKCFGIIAFVAVIGFSLVSCKESDGSDTSVPTSGKLKVTDYPAGFNGKYFVLVSQDMKLFAAADTNADGTDVTCGLVKNREATLKVWGISSDNKAVSFSGNDQNVIFNVLLDCTTVGKAAGKININDFNYSSGGTVKTSFTNGSNY
jgi:hypothetical protein